MSQAFARRPLFVILRICFTLRILSCSRLARASTRFFCSGDVSPRNPYDASRTISVCNCVSDLFVCAIFYGTLPVHIPWKVRLGHSASVYGVAHLIPGESVMIVCTLAAVLAI